MINEHEEGKKLTVTSAERYTTICVPQELLVGGKLLFRLDGVARRRNRERREVAITNHAGTGRGACSSVDGCGNRLPDQWRCW
jgi:hypothetical protein